MGVVYRGIDTQTQQPVAIKQLKPEAAAYYPDAIARFQREAQVLRQLHHPHIVSALDSFQHEGQYYIIMDYVAGGSLRQFLQPQPQLSIEQSLQLGLQIADALMQAHRQDIIHRDINPGNILIADDGAYQLTDFGVVYMVDQERLTQTGDYIGTLHYMSPEQYEGETVDARADIWSLGVMLYEVLAGQCPFQGENFRQLMSAILAQSPSHLPTLRPDVPAELSSLVHWMLEKDRDERIADMRIVHEKLQTLA